MFSCKKCNDLVFKFSMQYSRSFQLLGSQGPHAAGGTWVLPLAPTKPPMQQPPSAVCTLYLLCRQPGSVICHACTWSTVNHPCFPWLPGQEQLGVRSVARWELAVCMLTLQGLHETHKLSDSPGTSDTI